MWIVKKLECVLRDVEDVFNWPISSKYVIFKKLPAFVTLNFSIKMLSRFNTRDEAKKHSFITSFYR